MVSHSATHRSNNNGINRGYNEEGISASYYYNCKLCSMLEKVQVSALLKALNLYQYSFQTRTKVW